MRGVVRAGWVGVGAAKGRQRTAARSTQKPTAPKLQTTLPVGEFALRIFEFFLIVSARGVWICAGGRARWLSRKVQKLSIADWLPLVLSPYSKILNHVKDYVQSARFFLWVDLCGGEKSR